MEIDTDDIQQSSSSTRQAGRPLTVPVDDDHPFDLDSYISNYSGRTAIDRLIHIVSICPTIASEAYQLAVQHIEQSRDPSLFQQLLNAYENMAASNPDLGLPNPLDIAQLDTKWADETLAKNQADKVKLEVELKTYSNNMIKESIRMAHRDLGDFYRATGDYTTALKHYTKSREFCTTSQHVLDMCLSVLELLIEQRNYAHLTTYVFKADAALDAATAATSNIPSGGAAVTGAAGSSGNHKKKERDYVQSKLDLAIALSNLGQGNYEKAAQYFLRLGSTGDLGDWIGKLVAPGDIAIYGTLCALSALRRSAIKSQVLENSIFGMYIEQEPYVRELIEAYMNSNFKTALELLSRYSTRHTVDIHLAPHVHDLTNLIRNKAVVLYFQPFASIKLDRMSAAFGWTVEEVENHVVGLIQSGDIQARVDRENKILHAKKTDYRAELFARAIKAGTEIQATNRKLLLRMRLQQAELVIKPPKGSRNELSDYMQGGE
ncbi:26S proteasome subunit RPN7-domain-containing protein [Crucibulum laeve]|uniref:26S proteasome subunit RPN7-domain-containing protein n=1 Tax=Crucibulum laeve TaxID=68775 RepID=A0A5C3LIW2_9AGAR|nr:26S proteasome subunit RPN7-domain-containing protein [Crucibulum laeve]